MSRFQHLRSIRRPIKFHGCSEQPLFHSDAINELCWMHALELHYDGLADGSMPYDLP